MNQFQSTRLLRDVTQHIRRQMRPPTFQSTRLLRDVTIMENWRYLDTVISIHTSLTRRDTTKAKGRANEGYFNPHVSYET